MVTANPRPVNRRRKKIVLLVTAAGLSIAAGIAAARFYFERAQVSSDLAVVGYHRC
jgi:hypothetical protein